MTVDVSPEPRSDVPARPDLSEQARILRAQLQADARLGSGSGYGWLGKLAILALALSSVLGSVVFLVFSDFRRGTVEGLVGGWLSPPAGNEIVYSLPPPPPRTPATRPGPQFTAGSSVPDVEYEGVLYTRTGPPVQGAAVTSPQRAATGDSDFQAPPRTPEAEQALGLLREQRETVARILDGNQEGYDLVGWNPVKSTPPVFWIDVVVQVDGSEVHLVWEVDLDSQAVRPLSQAARDMSR